MDYKYIEQLLERYFQCETTLEEEDILRAFFAQAEVPVWLAKYKPLFCLPQAECSEQPLGDDFDAHILDMIKEPAPVKARTITLTQRLMPLFKVAAVVAIILTLGNAAQTPWDRGWDNPREEYAKYQQQMMDSVDMQQPIQAENLGDSAQTTPPTVAPVY